MARILLNRRSNRDRDAGEQASWRMFKVQRQCSYRHQKPEDDVICSILKSFNHIAVVGLSDDPWQDSNYAAAYFMQQGYIVRPVNPEVSEVFGICSYPDLLATPGPIETVQIFRRNGEVPKIVEQAMKVGAKAVWIEEGLDEEASVERARKAGLRVVTHRCMMVEHDLHLGHA